MIMGLSIGGRGDMIMMIMIMMIKRGGMVT